MIKKNNFYSVFFIIYCGSISRFFLIFSKFNDMLKCVIEWIMVECGVGVVVYV